MQNQTHDGIYTEHCTSLITKIYGSNFFISRLLLQAMSRTFSSSQSLDQVCNKPHKCIDWAWPVHVTQEFVPTANNHSDVLMKS